MGEITSNLLNEYLNDYDFFYKKYGEKTMVFIQVGSFFEAYSVPKRGPNLSQLSCLLNVVCTRKDKSMDVGNNNPNMLGVPVISIQRYIALLVNSDHTVVLKEQVTPPPNVTRKVTNIYSSGTYIENVATNDTKNIVCVYLEEEKQKNGEGLLCSGLSSIDLSTGKCNVYEALSTQSDKKIAIDETNRYVNSMNPTEIIIYVKDQKLEKHIEFLQLDNYNYSIKTNIPKTYYDIQNQNNMLKKIYKTESMLSTIESIDLEALNYGRISFLLLLNFSHEHNEEIIKEISKPDQNMNSSHLVLGNNAIFQLNVVSDDQSQSRHNSKFNSLFDVVNNTSTPMGYRFLKDKLISPHTCSKHLGQTYNYVEEFMKNNIYLDFEENLNNISDMERIYRKMLLLKLSPHELINLYYSLQETIKLHQKIVATKKFSKESFVPDKQTILNIEELIKSIEKTFSVSEMKKYSLNNINDTFFLPGVHTDIDKIKSQLQDSHDIMLELAKILNEYMADNGRDKNKKAKITVKKSDKNKFHLNMSKNRGDILRENLKQVKTLTVKGTTINIEDLIFDDSNKNNTKVTVANLFGAKMEDSDEEATHEELIKLTVKYYQETIGKYCLKYGNFIKRLVVFVSQVDFIKSNAKTAKKYNYTKPIIKERDASYVKCKQMRHPIIERIIDYEYVPHDIHLGDELKGMLLYGVNSSGKSSIMKALGLVIIMAQAGMYVPAQEFEYVPYTALFTRITGNDNLFKGLSSFMVEMIELKAIMKRSGKNTLVIGDEICKGTENVSSNGIVAASIINLSKSNSCFIFATHLHEIATMQRIIDLPNVKSFHISVQHDKKNNCLVYDRQLKIGPGEPYYGIIVAKYIIEDDEFINLATDIKNELMATYNGLSSNKKSRYNSKIMMDECTLCKQPNKKLHISPLETHHIIQQKDFDKDGNCSAKPHVRKNDTANLVVLCCDCHDKLHNNEYEINGYTMTSKGKKLVVNDKLI
jgi:DNA mismatch repair protein MutS